MNPTWARSISASFRGHQLHLHAQFFQGMAGLSEGSTTPTIYAHGRGVQALNV